MSWVEAIIEFARQFWPAIKVMQYERGVPYMWGKILDRETWWRYGGNLTPRTYLVVPWVIDIHTVSVTPDILKLWNLNVTTKDGVSLRVRANVRYEITDAIKAWNEVQDYKDNLGDECRTHLASVVRDVEYQALLADQGTVEREAKNAANKVVRDWGISVKRVSITDFTKTRDISLASV